MFLLVLDTFHLKPGINNNCHITQCTLILMCTVFATPYLSFPSFHQFFFNPRTSETIAFSPVPNIIVLKDLRMGRCEEELLEVGDEVSASLLTNYKPPRPYCFP